MQLIEDLASDEINVKARFLPLFFNRFCFDDHVFKCNHFKNDLFWLNFLISCYFRVHSS